MRMRVFTKSPVRENCTPGSVRGLSGNRQSYRDLTELQMIQVANENDETKNNLLHCCTSRLVRFRRGANHSKLNYGGIEARFENSSGHSRGAARATRRLESRRHRRLHGRLRSFARHRVRFRRSHQSWLADGFGSLQKELRLAREDGRTDILGY